MAGKPKGKESMNRAREQQQQQVRRLNALMSDPGAVTAEDLALLSAEIHHRALIASVISVAVAAALALICARCWSSGWWRLPWRLRPLPGRAYSRSCPVRTVSIHRRVVRSSCR